MSYLDPPPLPAPVVVMKDVGGVVRDYQARTEMYRAQNREIRLHECRSACTLALSLPNVCVYADSTLKFHQAYNQYTKEVDYNVSNELWTAYPPAVRQRLGELTRSYKILRGSELIALGVRDCNRRTEPPEIMIARAPATQRAAEPQTAQAYAPVEGPKDDVIQNAQNAVASLFSGPPGASGVAAVSAPPTALALPSSQPRSVETKIDAPLPPPRPPLIGVAELAPPTPPEMPAYLRPIPGGAPIMEAHFVSLRPPLLIPLRAASRKIASNDPPPAGKSTERN